MPHWLKGLQREKNFNPKLTVNDISDWHSTKHPELNERFKYLDKEFFKTQQPYKGAQSFVKKLSKYCDIFIHTAVFPEYGPERFNRVRELFPEIKPEHILFGTRKDLSRATFMLDDSVDNFLASNVDVPILMRRPWNQNLTGVIAANTYEDVLTIVKSYIKSYAPKSEVCNSDIIALIGPTGSGKNKIVDEIVKKCGYTTPVSFTTKPTKAKRYNSVSLEEFLSKKESGELLEYSVYGGYHYGLSHSQVNEALKSKPIIVPIDIAGAFMLRSKYNVAIVYVSCTPECLVKNILMDDDLLLDEKTNRILAINTEMNNERFADFIITDAEELINLIQN